MNDALLHVFLDFAFGISAVDDDLPLFVDGHLTAGTRRRRSSADVQLHPLVRLCFDERRDLQ